MAAQAEPFAADKAADFVGTFGIDVSKVATDVGGDRDHDDPYPGGAVAGADGVFAEFGADAARQLQNEGGK